MEKDQVKSLLQEKIDKANYTVSGRATISIDELNTNNITGIVEEIKNNPAYSSYTIEYNEETKTVNVVNPDENLEGFEKVHPSRKPCN